MLSSIALLGITGCPRSRDIPPTNIDKLPTQVKAEEAPPDLNIRQLVKPAEWMKTNWVTATSKTDFRAEYQTKDKNLDQIYDYYAHLFGDWALTIIEGNTFSVSMNDPNERVDIHGRLDDAGVIKWSLKYQKLSLK